MKITWIKPDAKNVLLALPQSTKQDNPKQFQIDSSKEWVFKYSKKVTTNARERISRIKKSIKWIMTQRRWFKKMAIYTTWSDWRLENKSHEWLTSNMEVSIVVDPSFNLWNEELKLAPRTPKQLVRIVKANVSFIIDSLDIKAIWKDSIILFENKHDLVFPTRIWDSIPIWWNAEIYNRLRYMVSEEILADPKLCRYFVDRLSFHRKLLSSPVVKFKWEPITHYDLERQLLHYNPGARNEGIKYGPLRVVQYSLALALMRKIRDTKTHLPFIEWLPTNILERIDFLVDNNLTNLSQTEAEDVKFIYAYFLKIYHQLQFENAFNWTTEFSISKDDMRDIAEMLIYLRDSFSIDSILN